MNYIRLALFMIFCASSTSLVNAQAPAAEHPRVFQEWMGQAFGVRMMRNAEGRISVRPQDNLPELASTWYRRNGQLGAPLSTVPISGEQHGDFLMISFDFSEAWPDIQVAKRHVIYYLGEPTMYALVQDEIKSPSTDFWTLQLQVPEVLVPVNWDINLKDTDRRADLLASVRGEFVPEIELNRPVSGYARTGTGDQMLLARLLRNDDMAERHADKMSPMNIRQQGEAKWLTTEVRSSSPSIQFAVIPYIQNRDELPMSILSQNALRMEWFDQSHRFRFFPQEDGRLEVMLTERSKDDINRYGFGMEYIQTVRPEGRLVAAYDFETLQGNVAKDQVGNFDAEVKRGRLVDGLQGKSIYLGYPDRPERNHMAAGITIPASIRQELTNGHMSMSFWYKSPMGQARNRPDNFAWPMGDAMRNRQYVDAGLFRVGHTHWQLNPTTRGFNAAWQERAESGELVPGKWNHLVFTVQELDAANHLYRYEVYVNGVIRTSRDLEALNAPQQRRRLHEHTDPIVVGNVWGTMDNLAIYNYPLGEEEILRLYSQQLDKKVSYYSCDALGDGFRVESEPAGEYPEDQIINNHWVDERSFAGTAKGATIVPGVKGKALSLQRSGLEIPEKALWDLSQGAFTVAFYFKYTGGGSRIFNTQGIRLDITRNRLHGAVGNEWEDRYLGYREGEIEADVWHHMVLAYDRREMVMYLNGRELYRRPMASREGIDFTNTITLGGNNLIDEVHLFNYAVSEKEVKDLSVHVPSRNHQNPEGAKQ